MKIYKTLPINMLHFAYSVIVMQIVFPVKIVIQIYIFLVKRGFLLKRLVILSWNWIVITMCFYGLSLSSARWIIIIGREASLIKSYMSAIYDWAKMIYQSAPMLVLWKYLDYYYLEVNLVKNTTSKSNFHLVKILFKIQFLVLDKDKSCEYYSESSFKCSDQVL